jgi:hypothetical protein
MKTRFVLVPGIGTIPANEWRVASRGWLEQALPSKKSFQVMCFHHFLRLDDHLSLQSVLDEGSKLLNALEQLQLAAEVNAHHLVIRFKFSNLYKGVGSAIFGLHLSQFRWCHSEAGQFSWRPYSHFAKSSSQALSVASFQYQKYGVLLGLIAGIIFLGTPDGKKDPGSLVECLDGILSCCSKHALSKAAVANLHDELPSLLDLATRFYNVASRIDILSCFEERQTRQLTSRAFRKSKELTV